MGSTAFLPKQVILMRHAEKTGLPGDTGLSPLGVAHAEALAQHWTDQHDQLHAIVACQTTRKSSRPVDTVRPLAARLGLGIDDRWNTQDYDALAKHLANEQLYRDRRVLICWRHDTLALLARSFGVPAPDWPDDLYGVFWFIDQQSGATGLRTEQQSFLST